MARQGERYNSKTKTGWKWEKGTQVYYHKGKKLNTLQILAKQGKEIIAPLTSGAQTIHDKLRIDPSSPTGESVYTTKQKTQKTTTGLQIGKFPILDESIAERQKKSDLWTQGSLITDSAFSRKFAPKELKKELGRTPEPKPKDTTYGTGMPSNYLGGHRGGGKVTDDFTDKTTSTTKTTTTEPSSSRELRIKNFKPSAIQKKLIAGGWSASELVDLQIKHENWRKKTGRA